MSENNLKLKTRLALLDEGHPHFKIKELDFENMATETLEIIYHDTIHRIFLKDIWDGFVKLTPIIVCEKIEIDFKNESIENIENILNHLVIKPNK